MLIVVNYDSGSKKSINEGFIRFWEMIINDHEAYVLEKQYSLYTPFLLESLISQDRSKLQIPIIIGGDHSITFFVVKSLLRRNKKITIIHFDAHHDKYDDLLNNYSVFFHLSRYKALDILSFGNRYDCERQALIPDVKMIKNPVYLSIDFDYFNPDLVSGVNFPVESSDATNYNYEAFVRIIKDIKTEIIGVDFMEWLGSTNEKEVKFVKQIFYTVLNRIRYHDI